MSSPNAKKDGTNLSVRAGRPVTQLVSAELCSFEAEDLSGSLLPVRKIYHNVYGYMDEIRPSI
jgi:hypothetical protein